MAILAHRKESNLSRTLRKLHEAGIVDFEEGPRPHTRAASHGAPLTLELDFVGQGSLPSVERPTVT